MLNLIALVISFAVVIIMLRRKINMGFSLVTGSFVMFVLSSLEVDPYVMVKSVVSTLIYSVDEGKFYFATIELAMVVFLIVILAKSMELTGLTEKLLNALRSVLSSKSLLAIVPAVLGLLHVPGGALFSVPMVKTEGKKIRVSTEDQAVYNVWFRHIWFLVSPLSSTLILICSEGFANLNIYTLILYQLPVFIFMIFLGVVMMRNIPSRKPKSKRKISLAQMVYISPVILPIVMSLILSIFFGFESVTSILISIPFGIILIFIIEKKNLKESMDIIKRTLSWKMPLAVIGIMIFRSIALSSGAVDSIKGIIESYSIPPMIAIISLPFILSILMGHVLGSVALSYPILQPLFELTGYSNIALTSVLYVSSFSSYVFSPLHLCVVVTNEYLKPDTIKFYKKIVPYSLLLIPFHLLIMLFIVG